MMLLNACQLTLCKVTKDNQNQFSPINTNNMRMLIKRSPKKIYATNFFKEMYGDQCREFGVLVIR